MDINLIAVISAVLLLGGDYSAAELDYKSYIESYEGPGWQDPYNLTLCLPVNSTTPPSQTNGTNQTVPQNQSVPPSNTTTQNTSSTPNASQSIGGSELLLIYSDPQIYNQDTKDRFNWFVNWTKGKNFSQGFGLGDQIDDLHKLEQLADFYAIDAGLTIPRDYLRGNHDPAVPEWLANDKRLLHVDNTCIAEFNSYNNEEDHGAWRQDQVTWLDETLAAQSGNCSFFVVLSHHGIYDPQYLPRPNAPAMQQVLDEHRSQYASIKHYRGHNEIFNVYTNNSIEYITLPAIRQTNFYGVPVAITFNATSGVDRLCYLARPCVNI